MQRNDILVIVVVGCLISFSIYAAIVGSDYNAPRKTLGEYMNTWFGGSTPEKPDTPAAHTVSTPAATKTTSTKPVAVPKAQAPAAPVVVEKTPPSPQNKKNTPQPAKPAASPVQKEVIETF